MVKPWTKVEKPRKARQPLRKFNVLEQFIAQPMNLTAKRSEANFELIRFTRSSQIKNRVRTFWPYWLLVFAWNNLKRASFEFLGWLPLGVVSKGPCQVVEGVGGGPEGVPSGTSRTNRKVLTPSGKHRKALLYKNFLKVKPLIKI